MAQTTREPGDGLAQESVDERFFAVLTDLIGAPAELVSADGESVWRSHTDLWGAPARPTEPPESAVACPLGLDGGPNPHAYVPNPTAIDPFGLALCRKVPRLEDGDLKQGWKHIDARHITGAHPLGPGYLMPPGTTREQVLKAASKAASKGSARGAASPRTRPRSCRLSRRR